MIPDRSLPVCLSVLSWFIFYCFNRFVQSFQSFFLTYYLKHFEYPRAFGFPCHGNPDRLGDVAEFYGVLFGKGFKNIFELQLE